MAVAITLKDVEMAYSLIKPHLNQSPLSFSPVLSEIYDREVFLKWESKLKSGAFKERGALNVVLNLPEADRKKGVCTASLGNHARGLSLHAHRLGIPCTIFMPTIAPLIKIQACEKVGATVRLEGNSFDDTLKIAQDFSAKEQIAFVHPFNHPLVIAGQGTCGLEIFEQCPDLDAIVVPVGGGGLIAGIATAIKSKKADTFVLGVQSEWAVNYQKGNHRRKANDTTIADGIAVKRIGDITGPIMNALVDKLISVSEPQIRSAIVKLLEIEKSVVEGAGAVPLCALSGDYLPKSCKKVVLVVSGGNIDMNLISAIIQRDLVDRGRILRFTVRVPDRPGLLSQVSGVVATQGGNVLDVFHDRFTCSPGIVEIGFVLEVRDSAHSERIIKALEEIEVEVRVRE